MSRGQQPLSDRRAFQCPADHGKTTYPKAGTCEAYVLRGQDVYPCAAIAQYARLRGRAKGLLPPQLEDYVTISFLVDFYLL